MKKIFSLAVICLYVSDPDTNKLIEVDKVTL